MSGSFLQISFYFLPIQIGIASLDDAVLHKQRGASCHKRGRH